MSEFIVERVEEFANSLLPSMGLELVEVQFRREGHGWVLRLFIDGEQGITVDHCADVSRELSNYLDMEDLIDYPYNLEVSSPGLERPLKTMAAVERFTGKKARFKLREPIREQKVFIGIINQVNDNEIELLLEDNTTVQFDFDLVRKARLSL